MNVSLEKFTLSVFRDTPPSEIYTLSLHDALPISTSRSPLMITPGSEMIFQTIKRDGQMAILESVGATVMANACGPCIGQWKRDDVKPGELNSKIGRAHV